MRPARVRFTFQEILRFFGIALALLLCSPLGSMFFDALQTASLPMVLTPFVRGAFAFYFLAPLFWILCALVSPFLLLLGFFQPKYRRFAPLCIAFWVGFVAAWPLGLVFGEWRKDGLRRATVRAQPVIAAIEKYRRKNGEYPATLSQLTPKFLARIPDTGMVGYPQFLYKKADVNDDFRFYELKIRTNRIGFNFDRFFYWPEGNYPPADASGQPIERIKNWAYLHE